MKTTLLLARTLLRRVSRDPMTLLVLFAIPIVLLLIFGAFLGNTDNISLRVAVVNNSTEKFAKDFQAGLEKMEVLKQPEEKIKLDEAQTRLKDKEIDGIIELPAEFGAIKENRPTGNVRVYYNDSDISTGDILTGIVNGVIDQTNRNITGIEPPLGMERVSATGAKKEGRMFDGFFAMFTSMAIMMVGVFGVASTLPSDKKSGVLRRMHVTPLKASQLTSAIMITYAIIGVFIITLMTALAVGMFKLEMHGSWLDYATVAFIGLLVMLGFGLAIGGLAKNTTQSDMYGQIVFLASLALSGLWMPRAFMPEFLQNIASFMPLTAVIDGIQKIVVEGSTLAGIGMELAVLGGWAIAVYIVAVKVFKWE